MALFGEWLKIKIVFVEYMTQYIFSKKFHFRQYFYLFTFIRLPESINFFMTSHMFLLFINIGGLRIVFDTLH